MQTKEQLILYPEITAAGIREYRNAAVRQVLHNLPAFQKTFPDSNSCGQFYPHTENVEWTTGFWTGQIWLAYEAKPDPVLLEAGKFQVESFYDRIIRRIDVNHHDMGFLYSPSCVAAYQLTGSERAKEAALMAADHLLERFQEKGQFFQAWGDLGDRDNYRLIIDCLLNMPLLFWAYRVTGERQYEQKAAAHIKTAMNHVIRPDHSTYHTYFFDPRTGGPIKGVTHQGNRDGSAWSRGQAWGIYGSALSYRLLRDPEYIGIFKKLTDYFLSHLPDDLIPYWDFDFDEGSTEPRDSSAAAIAVCGMLEMARHLPADDADYYKGMAKRLLQALTKVCAVRDPSVSNGLLLHGTYARASKQNPCRNRGVDECNTWGDYFYLEALTRLSKDWDSYW